MRSASLLEYLRTKYDVQVASFTLPHHSKHLAARVWRNGLRFARGVPPLIDRFAGFEGQLALSGRDRVAVIEHFWCAPYADAIRPHCDLLVLDLHNVESELAAAHARATGGLEAIVHRRFADAYKKLERIWIPKFDVVLVTSDEDRRRIEHRNIVVYPNALPIVDPPSVPEENCILFSGNLEYHPNIEAVRWFRSAIWPRLREKNPGLTWDLVGRNAQAVAALVKGDSRIRLIGPVDDAVAAIAAARVVVVPLLSGSGTRFKILEAWAARRAVVSTPIGAEGLGARDGEQLLIADEPASFTAAVQALLDNPARAQLIGGAGRDLYLGRYTWPAAWNNLAESGI
ncbi:MAG TPA: glycosyltransferase [Bryobacteraceae bacterium]|nr:glycosyltransferase [Bryobacteraceae bacterium]